MRQICTLDWEGLQADIALADHFSTIEYHTPVRSLSSAVLGGGFNEIRRVLNLKVQANPDEIKMTERPHGSLRRHLLIRLSQAGGRLRA